jgi:hypothetical protein
VAAKKVGDIIDVKNCVDGVKKAMEKENYEECASHIQRFLNIDSSGDCLPWLLNTLTTIHLIFSSKYTHHLSSLSTSLNISIIHLYLYISKCMLVLEAASIEALHKEEEKLKEIVKRKLDDATRADNEEEILRYSNLASHRILIIALDSVICMHR